MLNKKDCKIERFNDGKGGQNQNKSPKNVRMTHEPTGTVVIVRGRHYHKNVRQAYSDMEKKLEDAKSEKKASAKKAKRDYKIHNTETVRTYDLNKGIVKDHRSKKKASAKEVMGKGRIDLLR